MDDSDRWDESILPYLHALISFIIKVMRGYHYGDVAVKFLNMDHVEDEDRLEHFKAEVASFKVEEKDQRGWSTLDSEHSSRQYCSLSWILSRPFESGHRNGIVQGRSIEWKGKRMKGVWLSGSYSSLNSSWSQSGTSGYGCCYQICDGDLSRSIVSPSEEDYP